MSRARTFADLATASEGNNISIPNMIINGDCRVAQKGTSLASITSGTNFQVDRWKFQPSGHGTWTLSQNSSTGLSGFETSTKMLCTSNGGTPAAADFVIMFYNIEGHDTQRLKFGQSDAERFTVSWYVRSNKTGTGVLEAQTTESTASATVETSKTYTISQANTWEFKSVTFPANTDHAQATANKTTSTGLSLRWVLDSGTNLTSGTAQTTWANQTTANRWVGQNLGIGRADDDYMEMTGLQVDIGDVAQPFKYESFADNLKRCKRYFIRYSDSGNYAIGAAEDGTRGIFAFPAPDMRAAPTGTQGTLTLGGGIGSPPAVTAISSVTNSGHGLDLLLTVGSGLTAKDALRIRATDTASFLAFDAEL